MSKQNVQICAISKQITRQPYLWSLDEDQARALIAQRTYDTEIFNIDILYQDIAVYLPIKVYL